MNSAYGVCIHSFVTGPMDQQLLLSHRGHFPYCSSSLRDTSEGGGTAASPSVLILCADHGEPN